MKKILSIILCLAMILSLAVAASAASTVKNGEYVIADGNIAATALPDSYTYGYLYTVDTAAYGDTAVWTITKSGDYYTIKDCYGRYIYSTSYNSYSVSKDTQADDSHLWSITASGNTYTIQNKATGKYMGFDTGYGSWGCYPDPSKASAISLIDANPIQVPDDGSVLTIAEALEYAGATGSNRYIITGTITSIESEEYGNMYIEDETGSIYVYGLYSEDGSLKYSELETKPVVGDTIKVSTKLTVYNTVPQMSSAWLLEIVSDDTTTGGDDTTTGGNDTTTGGSTGDSTGGSSSSTTKPTEAKPVEYHGTKLSKLSDGDTVLIYSVANSSVMTGKEYTYEGSSYTKVELEQLEVSVKNNVVTYGKGAIVLTVHINDGKVSFTTPDGKYLYADGTDVKFVAEASEYTDFVLEETTDGYFIKCATATYNDKPQYLEVYSGYFTCYSKYEDSNLSLYTFQFFEADPETSAKTGDSISVIAALLLVSAAGIAIIGKKKEF